MYYSVDKMNFLCSEISLEEENHITVVSKQAFNSLSSWCGISSRPPSRWDKDILYAELDIYG